MNPKVPAVDLLEKPRAVSSHWHIQQAIRLLSLDGGRNLDSTLVYSAVELRAAIERTLLELLYLVKELRLTAEEVEKARSRQGVDALLKEADSSYRRTMEFTRLISETLPGIPPIVIVDTAYLRRRWSDLSEYCHAQIEPELTFESPNREFQKRGLTLVREVVDHYRKMYSTGSVGLLSRSTMPEETRYIYDHFAAGEIDADQARRMLEISNAVLERRPRK